VARTGSIRELEKRFENEHTAANLVALLRAYMDSREPRNLQKGLDLGLKNLESFSTHSRFLRHLSEMFLYIQNDSSAQKLALEFATRAVATAPADARSYSYLGYVYWSLGRLVEAIETAERALSMVPAEDTALQHEFGANLAYYLAETADKKNGRRALELARAAYNHDDRPSKADTLGYVLMKLSGKREDLEEAERLFHVADKALGHENAFVRTHLEEAQKLLQREITHQ